MESSAAQIAHEHGHHSHHRGGKRHSSRRKRTKKIVQRLGIMFFILIVMLVAIYIWVSSGSSESTSQLLHSSQFPVSAIFCQPHA
jgi:hypothetical protein